jgi:hypothetical protein
MSVDSRFVCPVCGKSYLWKPEHSGRRVKCGSCGQAFPVVDPVPMVEPFDIAEIPPIVEVRRSAGPARTSSRGPVDLVGLGLLLAWCCPLNQLC